MRVSCGADGQGAQHQSHRARQVRAIEDLSDGAKHRRGPGQVEYWGRGNFVKKYRLS